MLEGIGLITDYTGNTDQLLESLYIILLQIVNRIRNFLLDIFVYHRINITPCLIKIFSLKPLKPYYSTLLLCLCRHRKTARL